MVLAFEDLHWADPTTLDVLRGIAERGALAPLVRRGDDAARVPAAVGHALASRHDLAWRRSIAPRCATWWRSFPPATRCRSDVVEDVAARTGGVPLFVEEVTRLLLERGEQGGGIQAIPPTLQQSLMARLDRLGPAREVAQIGSVIGRGFSYGLLRDVAGMEDAPLQAALERLAEADIVLVQGLPPEAIIASSTRSFRMRLTRICSRAGARFCTAASPRFCATASPTRRRPSRKCWRITSPKRA